MFLLLRLNVTGIFLVWFLLPDIELNGGFQV